MRFLLNAIPGALVPPLGGNLAIIPCSIDEINSGLRDGSVQSAIGHADTAAVISTDLGGTQVPAARINVPVLEPGDTHYLALYQGPRLAEGTTELPKGASLQYYRLHFSQ